MNLTPSEQDCSLPVISELIVVEGIHDKQVVLQAVSAEVWVIGGDRVAKRFLDSLRRARDVRGVIVLTDPDGAGERIRKRIDQAVPGCTHAYVPKASARSDRGVGVEHAAPEVIRSALAKARTVQTDTQRTLEAPFTIEDLRQHGLAGTAGSAGRRAQVGERLQIGMGNAKSFVQKLNALRVSRQEWEEALAQIEEDGI